MLHWGSFLLHIAFEALQSASPKGLVITEPVVDQAQRLSVQAADVRGSLSARVDQTGAMEHAQMFGNGRAAPAEVAGNTAHGLLARSKNMEDLAARGIG